MSDDKKTTTKGPDRPSSGKEGVHGKFMVEVKKIKSWDAATRVMARRFLTEGEATDFFHRTSSVHQQKANRERVQYAIALVETKTERSPEVERTIAVEQICPIH